MLRKVTNGQQPKRPQYRLFVDESGDHVYSNLETISGRYLALLGTWFELSSSYPKYCSALQAFKDDIFGVRPPGSPVILTRSEIVNRRGPFGILQHQEIEERFNSGLLKLFKEARCTIVCVVIDKKTHLAGYRTPYHPYHYALGALLDRYCGWLKYCGKVGDVMAESRGKDSDQALQAAYAEVLGGGAFSMFPGIHRPVLTSTKIKMARKESNEAGLQFSDNVAHPYRCKMLAEKGVAFDRPQPFGQQVCAAVGRHMNRRVANNQLSGYGEVWLSAPPKTTPPK